MGRPHHFSPVRLAMVCAAVIALPLATGCSSGSSGTHAAAGHHGGQPAAAGGPPAVMVAGLEQLAAKSGCQLQSQTKAEELRQGACKSAKGRYTLLTFTSDQGQQSWLTEAKNWGGEYLVGPRWVAVGKTPELQALREEIGGDIQAGNHH